MHCCGSLYNGSATPCSPLRWHHVLYPCWRHAFQKHVAHQPNRHAKRQDKYTCCQAAFVLCSVHLCMQAEGASRRCILHECWARPCALEERAVLRLLGTGCGGCQPASQKCLSHAITCNGYGHLHQKACNGATAWHPLHAGYLNEAPEADGPARKAGAKPAAAPQFGMPGSNLGKSLFSNDGRPTHGDASHPRGEGRNYACCDQAHSWGHAACARHFSTDRGILSTLKGPDSAGPTI